MNKDVQIAEYFSPCDIVITGGDKKKYIEWSSNGKHKDDVKLSHFIDGFNALVAGKKRAGVTMGMWEDGVLEGSTPYFVLLGGEDNRVLPQFVVDFMKKEMFKGRDADIIQQCYEDIIHHN